ncbi:MAG: hypothetical protein ABSB70_22110 [Candidatus Velthaea sp.]|jgi:hypothetical protein
MANLLELKRTFRKFSTADRDATLARLAGDVAAMQRRWPRKVDFSGLLPDSAIAIFPLLFADAFGDIDQELLARFLAGCELLAGTIVIADALFDEELEREQRTSFLLCWQGAQCELQRELGRTFAPDSVFWETLQAALAEYLGGVIKEASYSTRRRRLADATTAECIAIASAKSCVSRVAIVGLNLLGSDASRTDALLLSLEKYNLAHQILDDLQDWKADLQAHRPTLVTARLATVLGLPDTPEPISDLAALARELYYGGHADEFLGLARANLALAFDAADRARPLPWHALLEESDRVIDALQRDLSAIVRRNRRGPRRGDVAV